MSDLPLPDPVAFPSDGTTFAAPGYEAPEPAPAPEPVPVDPAVDGVVPTDVAPAPFEHVTAPPGGEVLTLPSGYKVALRATRSVRARDRKDLFTGVDFESKDAIKTGMVVLGNIQKLMITAWDVRDFDDATGAPVGDVLPIPSATEEDILGGLSLEDANALDVATREIQKVLLPNFDPTPTADPTSPSQPSAG